MLTEELHGQALVGLSVSLTMFVLPLKGGHRYDLSASLAQWLDSDEPADDSIRSAVSNPLEFVLPKPSFKSVSCQKELKRLQAVRNDLTSVLVKSDCHKNAIAENAINDCYEYHAILLMFETQGFPAVSDSLAATSSSIKISWKGAFDKDSSEAHATLVWERAVITYNCAALITQQAASCPVDATREECKQRIVHCQQAASLLAILRELCESQPFSTVDLSAALLTFWESYLLAVAQDAVYRMMNFSDTPNNHSLALLSQSAHELYNVALKAAQDPRLQSDIPEHIQQAWATECKSTSMFCAAKASFHQSLVYGPENKQWACEIAMLRTSVEQCKAAKKFCKSVGEEPTNELVRVADFVEERLQTAEKDNRSLYHDYDAPDKLPDIPAKQLVKLNPQLPEAMLIPKVPLFSY